MSVFHPSDLVGLKADPEIRGTIEATWAGDIEEPSPEARIFVWFHKNTSRSIQNGWIVRGQLPPGYVVVLFMREADGACLVTEADLFLIDRALRPGDTVKLQLTDTQSGTVLSHSIDCELRPTLSPNNFSRKELYHRPNLIARHHFPDFNPNPIATYPSNSFRASLNELKSARDLQQDDTIFYHGWIGLIRWVRYEIAVRLSNGSVVVVEADDEVEECCFTPISTSYELIQRLHHCNFSCSNDHNAIPSGHGPLGFPFVGQLVQTAKGVLRRGRWQFGAYDPDIDPRGFIVETRAVEVGVWWLSSDLDTEQPKPPETLNSDVLQSGHVKLPADKGNPQSPQAPTIAGSTMSDFGFGTEVRFEDVVSAEQSHSPAFHRIPRASTLGYDVNVFYISSTKSRVLVRWQNGSLSEHDANDVLLVIDTVGSEVWPGDKVSLKSDEIMREENGKQHLHVSTLGVVQTVNPSERLVTVRWSEGADVDLDPEVKETMSAGSRFGVITDKITEVPMYDVASYTALGPFVGDRILMVPSTTPATGLEYRYGYVVEVCLDGDLIARVGPLKDRRDVKVPLEQMIVIYKEAMTDFDSETASSLYDEIDEMDWSDDEGFRPRGTYEGPAEIEIEYDDGRKVRPEEADEAGWSTEDDADDTAKIPPTADDQAVPNGDNSVETSSIPAFAILEDTPPADHHYLATATTFSSEQLRRVTKEHKILNSSLPPDVFVRSWESRLDLLRVMFVGPADTPYEFAPFFFDMQFGAHFPTKPPDTYFHSWTNKMGRVNPNLYEEGKVCLSLLGTWPSDDKGESWSPAQSTVLQILVSILGLVLVRAPYFNEAGFEVLAGSEGSRVNSRLYSENTYLLSKGFIRRALEDSPGGFGDIITHLYLSRNGTRLLKRVLDDCRKILGGDPEGGEETKHLGWMSSDTGMSTGGLIMLRRNLEWMTREEERIS